MSRREGDVVRDEEPSGRSSPCARCRIPVGVVPAPGSSRLGVEWMPEAPGIAYAADRGQSAGKG